MGHGFNSELLTGWWYTYPFEKYERQLGWWHSQYMESQKNHVPNHQSVIYCIYFHYPPWYPALYPHICWLLPYIPVLHSPPPMPPSQALPGSAQPDAVTDMASDGPLLASENATADCWGGKKNRPHTTGCVGWLVKHGKTCDETI